MKSVIVFLSGFFPVIINTYSGVRNVGRGLVEVALAEGANEAQIDFIQVSSGCGCLSSSPLV